jgi:hypothetical protein
MKKFENGQERNASLVDMVLIEQPLFRGDLKTTNITEMFAKSRPSLASLNFSAFYIVYLI